MLKLTTPDTVLRVVLYGILAPVADALAGGVVLGVLGWLKHAVEAATGWPGLVIIGVYSFLISFVLPLPSEVVLGAPLDLGLGRPAQLGLITVVSGVGRASCRERVCQYV